MTTTTGISRRGLITGSVVATGAAALAGCAPDYRDAIAAGDIHAARVRHVPVDDPDSTRWASTPTKTVELGPQDIALPNRRRPVVEAIRVSAIHDGVVIGFRIEWDDPDVDDLTVRVDDFRDACAVLLAPGAGDDTLRTMGTEDTAATLLHWKADWQRDIERGRSGLEDVYPNRSADVYPPLIDTPPDDVSVTDYVDAGVTEWLPGNHVGNPMSSESRATAVEKLVANGFGTSTTAATQNATGRGVRHGEGWRVTIAKPLAAHDDGETAVSPGGIATCAFAVWSGSDGDVGGRKSPSASVYQLVIDA